MTVEAHKEKSAESIGGAGGGRRAEMEVLFIMCQMAIWEGVALGLPGGFCFAVSIPGMASQPFIRLLA